MNLYNWLVALTGAGYVGVECSLDITVPPVVTDIRFPPGPECDVRAATPCTAVSLFVSGFSFTATFTCRVVSILASTIYTVFQKKVVHQAHIDNLANSQRIFIIPSLSHSGKFAIKQSSKISPHPKRVALWNINFQKLLEPKHDNRKLSAHELKKCECDHCIKPVKPATNSSFDTPSCASWCHTYYFYGSLSLKCFKRCLLKH